ncbi:sodium/calcium transporter, putative [Paecilomyces variotii No. 5]|uniref:Sodium/calcium transporter, putative n=1 Tax=Byssochlamys spectabilis (strain No. 5 / NBRC 109023) TaxID=1356009 RepID=V5I669_BYSSN|nr:sodium/calcium transporter, putative [Paecilomyces variotii No. 5]
MHIYRRHARQLAWYDDEGEPTNHNPFKKFRARPRQSRSSRLESGLYPVRTADDVRTSQERRRRADVTGGLSGPHHAESFPAEAESSSADRTRAAAYSHTDKNGLGQLTESNDQISSSDPVHRDAPGEGKPRRRRLFGKSNESEENDKLEPSDSQESVPDKQKFTVAGQLKATIFNSWINILLFAAPAGIAINYVGVDPRAIFVVNFIAIIPLAAMLSYATEEIAIRTGETIGGLLNATFGNAVELIVAILALVDNEVLVVQTSLIGSMLSNLLLVMGMCFFFGGVNRMEQHFNPVVAETAASLLALAVGSLVIPTAFHNWSNAGERGIAPLSRGTSIILLVVYGCYLFFQLKSHTEIYNRPSPKVEKRFTAVGQGDANKGLAQVGQMLSSSIGAPTDQQVQMASPEDEPEEPQLSIWVAVLTLAISTALVALCAEYMVGSINAITAEGGISKTFVGLILLPIVGNAAEHATAVTVACKDKMDLAIGVAVGSSMQIALLVLPLIVVIGWCMGNQEMRLTGQTLDFDGFQVILLFVAVLLVNYLIADGKSHWLEGVLLMTLYIIIAVAAWFYPSHEVASG